MKVEIYNTNGFLLSVSPTHEQTVLPKEVKEFADRNWEENHKGWVNSYIPVAKEFKFSRPGRYDHYIAGKFTIKADYSRYSDQFGAIKAILDGKDFAPKAVNGLSVSACAKTADKKIILPRRSAKVKHAPLVYNIFAGWMSSMNIDKANCEDPKFIRDPKLYDASWQARNEFEEESSLSSGYLFDDCPATLVRGLDASFNWSLVYRVLAENLSSEDVMKKMLVEQEEFAEGRKEHDKVAAVPVNRLETLLRNQPELQKEDKVSFEPSDVTQLILLDDTIGVLYNDFEWLTGKERPKDLIDYLGNGDIELVCHPIEYDIYPQ